MCVLCNSARVAHNSRGGGWRATMCGRDATQSTTVHLLAVRACQWVLYRLGEVEQVQLHHGILPRMGIECGSLGVDETPEPDMK